MAWRLANEMGARGQAWDSPFGTLGLNPFGSMSNIHPATLLQAHGLECLESNMLVVDELIHAMPVGAEVTDFAVGIEADPEIRAALYDAWLKYGITLVRAY